MRKLLLTVAATAALVSAAPKPAEAALITTLTGANTLSIGDKTFSDFTCSVVNVGPGNPTDCSGINVTTGTDLAGNLGINFQFASLVNTPGSSVDIQIGYTVTAPSAIITDIHMTFNGATTGSGGTNVSETVTKLLPLPSGAIVGVIAVNNPPPVLENSTNLTQLIQSGRVLKDIQLSVGATAGSASISAIGQYFSQVPEPASMALFGLAALGATVRRRLRK